jgi:peptidoglycan/LPS O-acetylase OafA/YrhL
MRSRVLSVLHGTVALNAIGGGVFGLAGASGVPVEWLQRTPFESYRVPSLILLTFVGGSHAVAAVFVWRQRPRARKVSLVAGVIVLAWIAAQLALIGYVSWLQPAVGIAGLANLALARDLWPEGRGTA